MKLLIVADDLSGAADCAAGCVQSGLRTLVLLDADADTEGFEVVAVDADSRHLPAADAATVQFELLRRLAKPRPSLLYKKIDSTLRGPFVHELAATRQLAGTPILAPSFPATGRTMVDGEVFVKGVALKDTEIWQNEGRTGPSTLPAMLQAVGFEPVVVSLAQVRGDPGALRGAFEAHAGAPDRAIVCDAESESDLARIAQATVPLAGRCQWVGSGGLMRHLPSAHGLSGQETAPLRRKAGAGGPALTVVGSVSTASRRQCRHVANTAQTVLYTIDPDVLREATAHAQWRDTQQGVLGPLARGEDLVVTIGGASPNLSEGPLLAASLARLVAPALDTLGGLILTGGETARAILSGWGVHALELVGELEAGIPLSYTRATRRIPVITKAGAFGSEDCLSRAWRLLKTEL
jgi:D-threonate/D-erythronate kinase